MSVITITRFTVEPADVEELRTRHTALVEAIKQADAGLIEASFGRVDDDTWAGIWHWDSADSLRVSRETPQAPEQAHAAFSLVKDAKVEDIEILDHI